MDRPVPRDLFCSPKVIRSVSLKTTMTMMMMMMMTRIGKMSNQENEVGRKGTYKNSKDRYKWTSRRKDMTLETETYITDSTHHSIP